MIDIEDILLDPGTDSLSKFDCRILRAWTKNYSGLYLMTRKNLKDTENCVTVELLSLFEGYFISTGRSYYEHQKKIATRSVRSKAAIIEVLAEMLSLDPTNIVVYCNRAGKDTNPVYKRAMKLNACVRLVRSRNEAFDFIMSNHS